MCMCIYVVHNMEQYCNACAMVLLQLLRVLNEPAVHVRTRAMKALSTIIAADPSILSRVGDCSSETCTHIATDLHDVNKRVGAWR